MIDRYCDIILAISIHAPARGASGMAKKVCEDMAISIHAPARGASALWFLKLLDSSTFQFTPLREGLPQLFCSARFFIFYFNSRPCERGFNRMFLYSAGVIHFNSRPCERGFQI